MTERVCIFRRIRLNDNTKRNPTWAYFERWDEDGFAWWTHRAARAHRFYDVGPARAALAEIRKHKGNSSPAKLVRVMGTR